VQYDTQRLMLHLLFLYFGSHVSKFFLFRESRIVLRMTELRVMLPETEQTALCHCMKNNCFIFIARQHTDTRYAIFNNLERPQTKISRSDHSLTLNISEMAKDTAIVTIENE